MFHQLRESGIVSFPKAFTASAINGLFYLLHEELTQKTNDVRKVFGGQLSPKPEQSFKSPDNLVT